MEAVFYSALITGGLGLVFFLLQYFTQKYVDKTFDQKFEKELDKYRNELATNLEREKSELSVWFELRKDILSERWQHHKTMVNEMTGVILSCQAQLYRTQGQDTTEESVELFRVKTHLSFALIPERAMVLCQEFFEEAHHFLSDPTTQRIDNKLKSLRNKYLEQMYAEFGVQEMMPRMAATNRA